MCRGGRMISGPAFSHARSRTHRGGTLGVPAYEMSPLIATATRRRKVSRKYLLYAPRDVVTSRFKRRLAWKKRRWLASRYFFPRAYETRFPNYSSQNFTYFKSRDAARSMDLIWNRERLQKRSPNVRPIRATGSQLRVPLILISSNDRDENFETIMMAITFDWKIWIT